MWCWRRLLRVSYTEHRTNDWVLKESKEKRAIVKRIEARKHRWLPTVLQERQLAEIVEGKINGRKARGRPRTTYWDSITRRTPVSSYAELKQLANRKEEWRSWRP